MIKNSSLDPSLVYILVQTFLKGLYLRFLVQCLERLIDSSGTLSSKTRTISTIQDNGSSEGLFGCYQN